LKNIGKHCMRNAAALTVLIGMAAGGVSADESGKRAADSSPGKISGDMVLVTVNGQPITRALFDVLVKARSGQVNPYDEEEQAETSTVALDKVDKKTVFDDLVSMEVLAQHARERGIHLRPEILAEAELQYKTLLQQELVRELIGQTKIDQADIMARYAARKPERSYKLSHILVKSEEQAKALIRQLNKGARFQELARKNTLDGNTKKDGALGWMMASQLEANFSEAAEQLQPGHYAQQPLQTPYGWHVIMLHAARDLEKPSFATARTWLRQEILHERLSAQLQQLQQAARIEVPSPAQASK
jgi:peptidyl-prolyl cis-trans isomerase C